MVINDLDSVPILAAPNETDAVLVVNPNTVLARPISPQGLQPVAGEAGYVSQSPRCMKLDKLPLGNVNNAVELA